MRKISPRTHVSRASFIAGTTKLATVRSATPSVTCPGFAYKAAGGCSACANRGLGSALTGATSATCTSDANSPCCNLPYFFLSFTGPTVTQYALMEFNVVSSVRLALAGFGHKGRQRRGRSLTVILCMRDRPCTPPRQFCRTF